VNDDILVQQDGSIATIVLNRPRMRNAINLAMWQEIARLTEGLGKDDSVRAVVFRGSGTEAFASGADISEFPASRKDTETSLHYNATTAAAYAAVRECLKPTIAMIHGFCMGGGLEVALACDLRYCGRSAQFGIPAAKLGLAYNVEGHKRLVETVGHARAREIMFLGRRYNAEEGFAMGLVNQVFHDAELEGEVGRIINQLCENAPLSIANSKTIIEEYVKASGAPDEANMTAAIERCAKSGDYQEGRRAFMEKRKPAFKGK
jgi:enoyl-CoA hydratase